MMLSIQHRPASEEYYTRKRREGRRHTHAVISLARRRVNVLWASLRDAMPYAEEAPQTPQIPHIPPPGLRQLTHSCSTPLA